MEFMDRRRRSLPVQFWLTVESFKNPLESIESDLSDDDEEIIRDPSSYITVKEDISMINNLYFSGPSVYPDLASISKKHAGIIQEFARDPNPSLAAQRRVRRSVMLAQKQIEQEMEQDFDDFERSELWFRAIGDTTLASNQIQTDPFAKDIEPLSSSVAEEQPPLSSAIAKHRPSLPSQISPRTDPPAASGIQRSASATSNRFSHAPTSIEVLMSPISDPSSDTSRAPLFNDPEDAMQRAEEKRMEAIQAALTDIMALEQEQNDRPIIAENSGDSQFLKSIRMPGGRKRQGVFEDQTNAVDPDEADEGEPEGSSDYARSFQLAAPGDLQLSYEIARLGDNIANLQVQDAMLDSLIKKAELTGDTQELRLLMRSKSSMNRELRELQFQKQQYEQQESANRLLSDRTKVAIVNSAVADEDGKSVVRYLIEVQQLANDGSFSSGWVVARRYNEFLTMHNKLRERYALIKGLDFPGKRLVATLTGNFLDNRKNALEKYLQVSNSTRPFSGFIVFILQNVVAIPIVCESPELRAFLSRESPFIAARHQNTSKVPVAFSGTDLVRNVYRSVAESIDDMFFGPSMLDVMIQRLTRQAAEFAGIVGSGVNDEDLVAQALNASGRGASEATLMKLSGDLKPLEGESSTSTFSAPICDLVLAVFELNKKNNWLRRQAIVIILQQVLGGTIERFSFSTHCIRTVSNTYPQESTRKCQGTAQRNTHNVLCQSISRCSLARR